MATFKLTRNGDVYTFDTQGGVRTDAGPLGHWATNTNNEIVVTPDAGARLTFPVGWRFNDSNQLLLLQEDGTEILNFGDEPPEYALRTNALVVQPGDSVSFKFELYPQWGLDSQNNLRVVIGDQESTLEGYVDDSSSRFIFWFKDEQSGGDSEYMLVFSGAWAQDASVKSSVALVFRGKVGGTSLQFTFKLAKAESYVDPAHNHLVLEYDTSKGRRRVELRGSLRISEKLGLTFTISEQRGIEGGVLVEQRQIRVACTFEFNRLSGNLELYVGAKRTPKSQKLTIGGAFQARLGSAGLDLVFTYEQERSLGGAPVVGTVALAVSGVFTWDHGRVTFSFERAGKRMKLDVTGQIEFEDTVSLDFGVTFESDQGRKRVKGFLGVSW
jgi:hypothetical protein